ncbi:MAG: FAD-dependent oxidoreductase [Nitrospinota bacterium]|nr:FAD-dependent oxidoreductase [Nitrospinota bacterium]
MKLDVAIIGAGPAGLGAGYALARMSGVEWAIFEATDRVGGLSSSRIDDKGFTWDLGGHVIFSNNPLFNSIVNDAIGRDGVTHTRSSFVKMEDSFVPFPLQNNIHRLPKEMMEECFAGMQSASGRNGTPANFHEWIAHRLGDGLARHFMWPYNRKVWDYPLNEMGYGWIDDRVSLPDLAKVKRAIETGEDDESWGGNATFRFPLHGGTGGLFERIAEPFAGRINFGQSAVKIDTTKKEITFDRGESVSYRKLITTIPLDGLIKDVIAEAPGDVTAAAGDLKSNGGWMVGIGIGRKIDTSRCWVYFPQEDVPFYRVTYFSNYSPKNVPDSESQTSFLCEITEGAEREMEGSEAVEDTLDGLIKTGLLEEADRGRVASVWRERLPYSYPIPTLGRDRALEKIQSWLRSVGIHSIGRFGGWRYEVGNMDHSFLAGIEAAEEKR